MTGPLHRRSTTRINVSRLLVTGVFVANLSAAIPFILVPERFMHGFEIGGVPGMVSVRGLGILFLMWNATFPPVIVRPQRYRMLFTVILVQQIIGLLGESIMWLSLPPGHLALRATGMRFILFDGAGLILLLLAFQLSKPVRDRQKAPEPNA